MKIAPLATLLLPLFLLHHPVNAVEHPGNNITAIEDLTRGAQVHVQGEVTRILDEDEFRLQDDTGSIRIYIGWRNRVTLDVGETVKVKGTVDDDLIAAFRPEIYASHLVRENGEVIELR